MLLYLPAKSLKLSHDCQAAYDNVQHCNSAGGLRKTAEFMHEYSSK